MNEEKIQELVGKDTNPFKGDYQATKGYYAYMLAASGELWSAWCKFADSRDKQGIGDEEKDNWWRDCIDTFDDIFEKYKDTAVDEYVRGLGWRYLKEIEDVGKGKRGI